MPAATRVQLYLFDQGTVIERRPHGLAHVRCRYRDWSLDRFAVDPFTLLRGNYVAGNDARKRQEEGSLKLGEIVLVYRDRRFMLLRKIQSVCDRLIEPELTRPARPGLLFSWGSVFGPQIRRRYLSDRGKMRAATENRRVEKEQPMTTIADLPALFHFRRPERAA